MSSTLKYGLIGAGMMGQEHIRNIALIEGTEVVALVEPDAQMLQRSLALAPAAKTFASLDEMLASDIELDALVIATPNYQHADQLLELFKRTALPILVEKPVITSLEQAEA